MNVLGISASCRLRGNTDILVRQALRGAEAEGAVTRFVRLTDYALQPCRGCMACVFKNQECAVKDRFPEVIGLLRWADAVAVGSPAYVLGATGALKNLHDRLIRYGMTREFAGRPGLALVAAGAPGWVPFSLSQVSLLFLFLGMPVVDQFVGFAQGPGEILFDEAGLARAEASGRALGRGERSFRGEQGACPVCHFDLMQVRGQEGPRCLVCDLPGTLERVGGRLAFSPKPGAEPRWSDAVIEQHFRDRVVSSGPRFKRRLREIRQRLAQLGLGGET